MASSYLINIRDFLKYFFKTLFFFIGCFIFSINFLFFHSIIASPLFSAPFLKRPFFVLVLLSLHISPSFFPFFSSSLIPLSVLPIHFHPPQSFTFLFLILRSVPPRGPSERLVLVSVGVQRRPPPRLSRLRPFPRLHLEVEVRVSEPLGAFGNRERSRGRVPSSGSLGSAVASVAAVPGECSGLLKLASERFESEFNSFYLFIYLILTVRMFDRHLRRQITRVVHLLQNIF